LYFDYVPISTYAFALNNPIALKDADGNEVVDASGNKVEISIKKAQNGEYFLSIKFDDKATDADRDQFNENAKKVFEAMLDVPHSRRLLRRAIGASRKVHVELVNTPAIEPYKQDSDAPFGVTTPPEHPEYPLNANLKDKEVWSIRILEKNIELTRDEIIFRKNVPDDMMCIVQRDVRLWKKRYDMASNFSMIDLRGIVGSHEIKHFLTENRGKERKANRSHKAVARQKNRSNNPKPHTRYKNPRFL
jgi:hypothetical protein